MAEDGVEVSKILNIEKSPTQITPQMAMDIIKKAVFQSWEMVEFILRKHRYISILTTPSFIPVKELNNIRREIIEELRAKRLEKLS
ncbi:MAG: DUF3656 domain-containing protein [Bacillus subtilis]|nr:DUF3656 domain-containing protein [Bacillus subtilis]